MFTESLITPGHLVFTESLITPGPLLTQSLFKSSSVYRKSEEHMLNLRMKAMKLREVNDVRVLLISGFCC